MKHISCTSTTTYTLPIKIYFPTFDNNRKRFTHLELHLNISQPDNFRMIDFPTINIYQELHFHSHKKKYRKHQSSHTLLIISIYKLADHAPTDAVNYFLSPSSSSSSSSTPHIVQCKKQHKQKKMPKPHHAIRKIKLLAWIALAALGIKNTCCIGTLCECKIVCCKHTKQQIL